jgi:hypothetical protein
MIMVVTDIQGDDDLILQSALNRGTSTVSQFFIVTRKYARALRRVDFN